MSSAVAAALSAGIIGLMVSRGSSLILESIDLFKDLSRTWENCNVSSPDLVSGLLIGFNGFIWSQAVIVEVYTWPCWPRSDAGVPHALRPSQRRYLYAAFFLFGLCFANHQTPDCCSHGHRGIIAMATARSDGISRKHGDLAPGVAGHLSGKDQHLQPKSGNPRHLPPRRLSAPRGHDLVLAVLTGGLGDRLHIAFLWRVLVSGAVVYLYMPIASMSNPPMNWGYPRTWEGFIHAFTRGAYEKTSPTGSPLLIRQLFVYAREPGGVNPPDRSGAVAFHADAAARARMDPRTVRRLSVPGRSAPGALNPTVDSKAGTLVKVFFHHLPRHHRAWGRLRIVP